MPQQTAIRDGQERLADLSPVEVRRWRSVSWLSLGLFTVLLVVDLVRAVSTHAHWTGDIPAMLAWEGPLFVMGVLLRSRRRGVRQLTIVVAALFATWAMALLIGNWDTLPSAWGIYVAVTQTIYVGICLAALIVELLALRPSRNSRW